MAIPQRKATFEEGKNHENGFLESAPGHNTLFKPFKHRFLQKGHKRDKHRFLKKEDYTTPEIKRFPGKWYVEYYYNVPYQLVDYYPRSTERFKVYENINSQNPENQETFAALLRDSVEQGLKDGYSPFDEEIDRLEQIRIRNEQNAAAALVDDGKPILLLLEDYLEAKTKEGCKAIPSFKTTINHFKVWMAEKEWTDRGINLMTEDDMIEFLNARRVSEEWGTTTYNTNRTYVFMWFNWFVKKKILKVSPLTDRIDRAKTTGVTRNEDYQGRVRTLVNKELKKDPILSRLCRGVYYTCARSYKEFCFIKIWHVDRAARLIKVPDGKTGYRHIPLCDELEDMLFNEMKIDSYPHDYYIFGPNAVPSAKYADKNHFSNRYKKLKIKLKLGIEYSIYGWKHTRVCDLLASGLYTDQEVMELTGHTDTRSFDKYKRGLGRRITNKLKGKTISFD